MSAFWKSGDPFIWLSGAGLAISLLMVGGLVALLMVNGLGYFWPKDVDRLELRNGEAILGEVVDRENVPGRSGRRRLQVKRGNRDIWGNDFVWVDEADVVRRTRPSDGTVFERREWGNLYGILRAVREGERVAAEGSGPAWEALRLRLPEARRAFDQIRSLEKGEMSAVHRDLEKCRLKLRRLELKGAAEGPEAERIRREIERHQTRFTVLQARLEDLRRRPAPVAVVAVEGTGDKEVPLSAIVRAYRPNTLGVFGKAGIYLSRFWEFISDEPRESNTEGGIFPAIFGTVLLVLIMSVFVMPLGVLAALYLREYARQGTFVSLVRIAVNNLAGVPSIVFGVFGVGFFIYTVGGGIDRFFFPERLPSPTFGTGGILWASLTLALLTVPVVIVATEEGLASIPRGLREASLALGATKFETTWRAVLPSLIPSILTGLILAMARAAGEVAPLMITGVVKLAATPPLDGTPPFLHLERKFMHLGFHIYDVGFQSPNVEAAQPMVFTTAFLLLLLVVSLNLTAIALRRRLRKKYYAVTGL